MQLTEETGKALLRELKRLNNLNGNPANTSKKWVKVSTITELTDWDGQRLRRARENNEIEWKKEGGGFWYNPSSLNPIHIKLKATA